MDRLHVLIGDDVAEDAAYRNRSWPFTWRRLPTPRPPDEPFNYAAKMNRLWRAAETEHVVLMNDDLLVRTPDWLEALMTFAADEDVGGVGSFIPTERSSTLAWPVARSAFSPTSGPGDLRPRLPIRTGR